MDPIADFINTFKIASRTKKESFLFPSSRFVAAIAQTLLRKGYVASVGKKGKKGRQLEITFPTQSTASRVLNVKRVSLLSKRLYRKASEIRPIRNGFGASIISTPKGILTDNEAREANVGGEVLFEIW